MTKESDGKPHQREKNGELEGMEGYKREASRKGGRWKAVGGGQVIYLRSRLIYNEASTFTQNFYVNTTMSSHSGLLCLVSPVGRILSQKTLC